MKVDFLFFLFFSLFFLAYFPSGAVSSSPRRRPPRGRVGKDFTPDKLAGEKKKRKKKEKGKKKRVVRVYQREQ